jgi:hypothetical protein
MKYIGYLSASANGGKAVAVRAREPHKKPPVVLISARHFNTTGASKSGIAPYPYNLIILELNPVMPSRFESGQDRKRAALMDLRKPEPGQDILAGPPRHDDQAPEQGKASGSIQRPT